MRGSRVALLLAAAALLLLVVVAARGIRRCRRAQRRDTPERGTAAGVLRAERSASGRRASARHAAIRTRPASSWPWSPACWFVLAAVSSMPSARAAGGGAARPGRRLDRTRSRARSTSSPRHAAQGGRRARRGIMLAGRAGTPGDAVIEAWLTLEHATEHGRAPHRDAPPSSPSPCWSGRPPTRGALRELRTLYQRARFGTARRAPPTTTSTAPVPRSTGSWPPSDEPLNARRARRPRRRRGRGGRDRSRPRTCRSHWALLIALPAGALVARRRAARRHLRRRVDRAAGPAGRERHPARHLYDRTPRAVGHRPVPLHLPRPAAAAPDRASPRSAADLDSPRREGAARRRPAPAAHRPARPTATADRSSPR